MRFSTKHAVSIRHSGVVEYFGASLASSSSQISSTIFRTDSSITLWMTIDLCVATGGPLAELALELEQVGERLYRVAVITYRLLESVVVHACEVDLREDRKGYLFGGALERGVAPVLVADLHHLFELGLNEVG